MIKLFLRVLMAGVLLAASQLASASQTTLKTNHPDIYYVKKGDTLWDIADKFLQHPWQWPQIWQKNQQIANPHLIYPGDELQLIWVNGQPRIKVKRGYPVAKLSPHADAHPITAAIKAVSLSAIQPFLRNAQVVTPAAIKKAPYLLGGDDDRNLWATGDTVYVRSTHKAWGDSGSSYGVYRIGKPYIDPQTGELLGREALLVGHLALQRVNGDIATMKVTDARRGLKANDRIFPSLEHKQLARYFPKPPKVAINGQIIRLFDAIDEVGRHDVVVINKGQRDGLAEGNLLQIRKPGRRVVDSQQGQRVRLPSKKVGSMLLFRVFDKVSFGLIMKSEQPVSMNDRVVTPE